MNDSELEIDRDAVDEFVSQCAQYRSTTLYSKSAAYGFDFYQDQPLANSIPNVTRFNWELKDGEVPLYLTNASKSNLDCLRTTKSKDMKPSNRVSMSRDSISTNATADFDVEDNLGLTLKNFDLTSK